MMANAESMLPRSMMAEPDQLRILDQRQLPRETVYLSCRETPDVIDAIKTLAVRGAPAIGLAAAYGLLLGRSENLAADALLEEFEAAASSLIAARPTAVNLAWAVEAMMQVVRRLHREGFPDDWPTRLRAEADRLYQEDRSSCLEIGRLGASLIPPGGRVLTHCNAGSLAVSEFGTALAPIYVAHDAGNPLHVFVDETRPLLQGARLTAFELMAHGVPCTLITDNMAAHVMASNRIDLVIVGADRVAANGDAANKIGTLGVAVLAKHFHIPFYVACPFSTVDLSTARGEDIEIEERHPNEVTSLYGTPTAPENVQVFNPAFDVTPASLIDGIITERGLITGHLAEGLKRQAEPFA
jgi:methylthioribose-1-phosphate isomerase